MKSSQPEQTFWVPLCIKRSPVGRSNKLPIARGDGMSYSFSHIGFGLNGWILLYSLSARRNCFFACFASTTAYAFGALPPQTTISALMALLSGVSFHGKRADIPDDG